ncbi:MAG: MFS transporter [Parahaliea sp.]
MQSATSASTPVPPADDRVGFKSWWLVGVLFFLYVFSWLDRLIIAMLVGDIKADLHLTDFQISLILGPAFAICYSLFGLPMGWAVDRYPRRWVVYFGVTVWALATMASGFARNFTTLLLGRVGVGMGEATLMPAAYSLIADEFPQRKLMFATSIYQMGGKIGSATAFGLGGLIIAFAETLRDVNWPMVGYLEPWQMVLMMVGAPGLVFSLLVFTFSEPARKGKATTDDTGAAGGRGLLPTFLGQHWQLLTIMMVGFSAVAVCGYSLTSWIPEYIERTFHWEPIKYGPALSAMNILAAFTLVFNGRIVDWLYARGVKDAHLRFYAWLIAALLPVALLMFSMTSGYVFLGMFGVIQIVTVPFILYVSAVVAMLAPNQIRGQLIALALFVTTNLGMGLGPVLVGSLTDYVFHDEAMLGRSLSIVISGGFIVAMVSMMLSLKYLRPAVERAEARREAEAAQTA